MSLVLRWRVPEPPIVTRWRGPAGIAAAVTRRPLAPIAAVIGPPGPAGAQGVPGPQGPQGQPTRIDFTNAATWIAAHSLGRVPVVLAYLNTGEWVAADTTVTSFNLTVVHAQPQTGFVLLV